MIYSKKVVKELIKKFDINTDVVPIEDIYYAMHVEYEHSGTLGHNTNVTNGGDPTKTFKILVAHLIESPFYYKYLKKMEQKLEKYHEKHGKESIFNK